MAMVQTTASGAIKAGDTKVKLTAFTNPSTGPLSTTLLRVDGEIMRVTDTTNAPTLGVTRGDNGTAAAAHNTLATIAYGLTTDFVQTNPYATGNTGGTVTSYGSSGAITIPTTPANDNNLIFLNKATAAAMTLAAPGLDQDGLMLTISSNTAAAHTVTATGLLNTGTSSVNVATFAADAGAGLVVQAARGLWNVISSTGITFS